MAKQILTPLIVPVEIKLLITIISAICGIGFVIVNFKTRENKRGMSLK